MSKLKNYTSSIAASQSMARIEEMLVEAGATNISKTYGPDKTCCAIIFVLEINEQDIDFKLPANIDACFKVLWNEVKRPGPNTKENTRKQAERTAWKIVHDWVDAQLAMIRLEQVKPLQIFLPYMYHKGQDKTFYEIIEHNNPMMLLPPP